MSKPHNKIIEIPYDIYKDFLDLLDSTQCQFTEEELKDMAPNQIELITYISNLVGEGATPRFKSIKQQAKASRLLRAQEYLYP
jgi:hypothetical protein